MIKTEQVAGVLMEISTWKTDSYFKWLNRLRTEGQIYNYLNCLNISNNYEKEYYFALEYDSKRIEAISKIQKILQLKMSFWKELVDEHPRL